MQDFHIFQFLDKKAMSLRPPGCGNLLLKNEIRKGIIG